MVTTLTLALALTTLTQNQDPTQQPAVQQNRNTVPRELDELKFMLGTWEGKGTGNAPDKSTSQIDGSANVTLVMDRWIQWETVDNAPERASMQGRFMMTYNPLRKVYEGVWFDNQNGFATDFTGNFANGTLNLTSEPVQMEEGGSWVYTATYTKKSDTEMTFTLSTNMDGQNVKMVDYVYMKR